jgi:hypothetical protein
MPKQETPAEIAYRLKNEARCAEIARELKAKLEPEGLAFCLVLATVDGAQEEFPKRFGNMSYVSTCAREDAARLLTELVNKWWASGVATEPTAETCALMRETVYKIRGTAMEKVMNNARHRVREVIAAKSAGDRAHAALLLACEAMAIFDVESRRVRPQGN